MLKEPMAWRSGVMSLMLPLAMVQVAAERLFSLELFRAVKPYSQAY